MDGVIEIARPHAQESRWFEDFFVGERFVLPVRRLTPAMFEGFAEISGEAHPLHTDAEYCAGRGLPGLEASALMVTIQSAAGAGLFPFLAADSLIGLIEQSSRCIRAAYAGDTMHPVLQVAELIPSASTGIVCLRSTIHNQRRELVMDGMQRWSLRKTPRT